MKFVIDSAFCTSNIPFLIKSSQDDLTANDEYDNLDDQIASIAMRRTDKF